MIKFHEEIQVIELHAFADASSKGVSSVVYAIIRQSTGVSRGLIAVKARLAKQGLTIPQLKLVSAHMAANLVGSVKSVLKRFPVMQNQVKQETPVVLRNDCRLIWIAEEGRWKVISYGGTDRTGLQIMKAGLMILLLKRREKAMPRLKSFVRCSRSP